MTVIVGVLCKDGIVIGSDSSATSTAPSGGNFSIPTVEQKTKKVDIIHDFIVFGGTGSVGLGQRFKEVVKTYFSVEANLKKSPITISQEIYIKTRDDFAKTNIGINQKKFGAVMGFSINSETYLLEYPVDDFQPEFKSNHYWYVSMGSGQLIADPFLGFVRKVFWNDEQPTLNTGIFGTLWVLEHAIDVNPGGIGAPPQICVLKKDENNDFKSYIIEDIELQEHIENLKSFQQYIKDYKNQFIKDGIDIPNS